MAWNNVTLFPVIWKKPIVKIHWKINLNESAIDMPELNHSNGYVNALYLLIDSVLPRSYCHR